MLYLIIAKPRTGKSQLAVSKMYEYLAQGKQVFVTNFNQTDEQRERMGVIKFDEPNEWWEKLPAGAVWFVDETQQIWPQRGKSTPLPEYIKQLSLHGHKDLTIYLITQDAMQVDVHIRRNTNFTLYMTRPLGLKAAKVYTFRDYQEIPNDAWRRSQALKLAEQKQTFRYKAKFQDSYVSASAHEHIKPRLPKRLLVLPIAVGVVVYALWSAWSGLRSKALDDPASPTGAVAAAVVGAGAPTQAAPAASVSSQTESEAYIARFTPRVPDVPWSAPAYDGFPVKDYPRPLCYIVDWECKCKTQQATTLNLSDETCRTIATDGAFDPFKDPYVVKAEGTGPPEPSTGPGKGASSASNGEFRIMGDSGAVSVVIPDPTAATVEPILPVASPP